MKILFLGFLLISMHSLFSADKNSLIKSIESKKLYRHPILFEIEKQSEQIKSLKNTPPTLVPPSKLVSNRIYFYYLEKESRWMWTMTDANGNLADPIEGIRSSTVVNGAFVGAKNRDQKYLLNIQQVIWVPTFQPEQRFLWVYEKPPEKERLKVVTFLKLDPKKNSGSKK